MKTKSEKKFTAEAVVEAKDVKKFFDQHMEVIISEDIVKTFFYL